MKQETQELTNLPLSFLISAPLNAAIEAQRAAALSTAAFIEQVGFKPKKKGLSLFSSNDPADTYDSMSASKALPSSRLTSTARPRARSLQARAGISTSDRWAFP